MGDFRQGVFYGGSDFGVFRIDGARDGQWGFQIQIGRAGIELFGGEVVEVATGPSRR